MGRTEPVGQVHKVLPVHHGLLEALAGLGEVHGVDGEILHDLLLEPVGVFAVELLAQRLALFQGDLVVADLLGGIVGGAADAVLDVGGVVEEVVDLVVDGVVLGVGALGALGRGAEAAVLHAVIVGALGMPLLVIAQIPHLNVVFLQVAGLAGQVDGQVGLVDLVVLLQLAQAYAAQIDVVVVVHRKEVLVPQGGVVVGDGVAELGLVFAVEHQRNAEAGGHLGGQLLLAQNERLEGMEQVLGGQPGEQPVGHAVGGAQVVVKPGVDPCLEVVPAPGGVHMGCPGDGEGVHPVLVFQQMGGVKAVLTAGAGHQAVVAAVGFAVLIAQFPQFPLPLSPVDGVVFLVVAGVAGVAHAVRLNDHGLFPGADGVLKFVAAVGLLVAHHALFAELHLLGQPVVGFQLVFGNVRGVFGIVDGNVALQRFHMLLPHSFPAVYRQVLGDKIKKVPAWEGSPPRRHHCPMLAIIIAWNAARRNRNRCPAGPRGQQFSWVLWPDKLGKMPKRRYALGLPSPAGASVISSLMLATVPARSCRLEGMISLVALPSATLPRASRLFRAST